MSFLLGRTNGNEGILISDSILTRRSEQANSDNILQHNLKIHILDRKHCIGIAGLWSPGVDAAVDFSQTPIEERDSISSHLVLADILTKRCERFGYDLRDCELIYMRKYASIELFVIKNGLPQKVSEGFIGNPHFFADFQESLSKTKKPNFPPHPSITEFMVENSRILDALRVIENSYREVRPLGDYQWVRVGTDDKYGFLFLASAISKSTEGFGRPMSMIFVNEPIPSLALYLEEEKKGYLFQSGSTDFPKEFLAESHLKFTDIVKSIPADRNK